MIVTAGLLNQEGRRLIQLEVDCEASRGLIVDLGGRNRREGYIHPKGEATGMDEPAQTLGLGSPVRYEIAIRVRCVYPSPMTDGNVDYRKIVNIYDEDESKIGVGSGIPLPSLSLRIFARVSS